jgi:hypothetical protein
MLGTYDFAPVHVRHFSVVMLNIEVKWDKGKCSISRAGNRPGRGPHRARTSSESNMLMKAKTPKGSAYWDTDGSNILRTVLFTLHCLQKARYRLTGAFTKVSYVERFTIPKRASTHAGEKSRAPLIIAALGSSKLQRVAVLKRSRCPGSQVRVPLVVQHFPLYIIILNIFRVVLGVCVTWA